MGNINAVGSALAILTVALVTGCTGQGEFNLGTLAEAIFDGGGTNSECQEDCGSGGDGFGWLGDEVIPIEMGLNFNQYPYLNTSQQMQLTFPSEIPSAGTQTYIYFKNGPANCSVCAPWDQNLAQYSFAALQNNQLYTYNTPFSEIVFSFFFISFAPQTDGSLPQVVGYTTVKEVHVTAPPATGSDWPIVFVGKIPVHGGFTGYMAPVANHWHGMDYTGRGDALYIQYPGVSQPRNLTLDAGWGVDGLNQTVNGISVRNPTVHWDAQKIVFSMARGKEGNCAYTQVHCKDLKWKIYEIANIGQGEAPVITYVDGQPDGWNNTDPVYTSDDKIVFNSDYPKDGKVHLYPYKDEYEIERTNAGTFKLDPDTETFWQLDDSPSGNQDLMVDSYGRVLFTRWDHLTRDRHKHENQNSVTYPNEETTDFNLAINAHTPGHEFFPESSTNADWDSNDSSSGFEQDTLWGKFWNLNRLFNHFLIWEMNQDGTELETLNHVGRHELKNDLYGDSTAYGEFGGQISGLVGQPVGFEQSITHLFQINEDANNPGTYYMTNSEEFHSLSGGQIIKVYAPKGLPATQMTLEAVTKHQTYVEFEPYVGYGNPPSGHPGFFRNPHSMQDGSLIASWSPHPQPGQKMMYNQIYRLEDTNGDGLMEPATPITPIIQKHVQYDPDNGPLVTHNGPIWQLEPAEVRPRARPQSFGPTLPDLEKDAFAIAGVNESEFRQWLVDNDLSLITMRDLTTRAADDRLQPSNLGVVGGEAQTVSPFNPGTVWNIEYLHLIEGRRTRGYLTYHQPENEPPYYTADHGRRIHPEHMSDPKAIDSNEPDPAIPGSVRIRGDGSAAAFVPSRTALSWETATTEHQDLPLMSYLPIVRERYWVTFQPGEIRVCTSCHGINDTDQAGNAPPGSDPASDPPQALIDLLNRWKTELQ